MELLFSNKKKIMKKYIWLLSIGCLALLFSCGKDDDDTGGNNNGGTGNVQITVSDISKFEGDENSIYEFKIRISRTSEQTISVDYTTVDAAAVSDEDFIATSGRVSFSGSTTEQVVAVEILADTIKEADEDFFIELSNPTNAIIDKGVGTGILRNDDTFLPNSDEGYITPTSYAGFDLVWQDEFDGTEISDCWTHETGDHGWGNNELQNYTTSSSNSFVSNGKLYIEARQQNSGSQYTSARMITSGCAEFQYGRIDIRAKLPQGQGIWPALWMLGANFWTVGWPHCGEIDIMELVGHEPNKVHGTIHWQNEINGQKADTGSSTTLDSGIFADEFHVFTIIWDNQKISWFVDDEVFREVDITASHMTEFHAPHFFIFNIAVGGNWPGNPNASTVFPQQMVVDYIRVFQ